MFILSRHLGTCAVALLATSAACSLVVDTDNVQCRQPEDCTALGFPGSQCVNSLCVAADPAFACREVPFAEPSAETVDYTLEVVNLIGLTPYEGLTVIACPNLDVNCDAPVGETTTDAAGDFTLPLQEGFRGHLFVPPPDTEPTLAPLKAHIFPPPSTDPTVPVRAGLAVTSLDVLGNLAAQGGGTIENGRGHIFFTVTGCDGLPLAGVAVSSPSQSPETLVAYLGASGQPDLALDGTGVTGQGAMSNLPPGFVTIRGVHETEGLMFEQSVIIAADTITSVPIVPSPTP